MTYCLRYRWRATGQVFERSFDTALARTLFIIGFERFGTVLEEWMDEP